MPRVPTPCLALYTGECKPGTAVRGRPWTTRKPRGPGHTGGSQRNGPVRGGLEQRKAVSEQAAGRVARSRDVARMEDGPGGPGAPDGPAPVTGYRAINRTARQSSHSPDGLRLRASVTLRDLEFDPLPLFETAVAIHLDGGEVHEHVPATVDRDEAVALVRVEPLDGALSHYPTTP